MAAQDDSAQDDAAQDDAAQDDAAQDDAAQDDGGQGGYVFPGQEWDRSDPNNFGFDIKKLHEARDYALTGGGAGMIVHSGRLVLSWGDVNRKFDVKSSSKSIGATALGLAIDSEKIKLSDLATKHHPSFGIPPAANATSGDGKWLQQITIEQLATQTAGFDKPGGYQPLLFAPGTRWHYSDGGPNWLAECVTLTMKTDIQTLLFDRVLGPIGVTPRDLHWRRNAYRDNQIDGYGRYEFGSGVNANVNALARIGLLYLAGGTWNGKRLLSESFVDSVGRTRSSTIGLKEWDSQHGNASDHYGLLWWNNSDGSLAGVPRDAYWSWGLHESFIIVIPSLDMVVARVGSGWRREKNDSHYKVVEPFLQPICAAIDTRPNGFPQAPYPQSRLIKDVHWDAANKIVRRANGSDNWPITWLDDDSLFTAYGDGWGFRPKSKEKLSLGFAKVTGDARSFRALNVRSKTGERTGQGKDGVKASGLLMVDGVLYMWARNAGNSQLAASHDRGKTWAWADWKLVTSFGCPTFVNYGRNYAGSRDEMVYVVSPDSSSAYRAADSMVMARVHRDRILQRSAYEFFVSSGDDGVPVWSSNVDDRGAVFQHAKRCYRGGISYNAPLKRYLWCQTLPESKHPQGPRFQGGFGIYEAPEPWGPWSTIFFTEAWDVGPGESSCLPTKWISEDGRTVHLLFSGDDAFSVRRGRLLN